MPNRFIRCHNAYIVNVCKIASINHSERSIQMLSGGTCYYSDKNRKALFLQIESAVGNGDDNDNSNRRHGGGSCL